MSKYHPDRWVVVLVKAIKEYKILGGWSGGYLDGDSWRLSSGITKVEETKNGYNVTNHSGSVYYCDKQSAGFNVLSAGVFELFGEEVKRVDMDTVLKQLGDG